MDNLANPFNLLASYGVMFRQRHEIATASSRRANSYLAFQAGDKKFIVKMDQVMEVITEIGLITSLPFSKIWLLGLISHRGDIFSVVDFASFLGDRTSYSSAGKKNENYILLRNQGHGYVLKVNTVFGIRTCEVSEYKSDFPYITQYAQLNGEDWLLIDLDILVQDDTFLHTHLFKV